jgi:hypothetical protein
MAKSTTENLPPSNKRSVLDWAEKFDELLLREKKIVFEIGDALIAAQEELTKKGFLEAIAKSGLKMKTTALNYMRVAQAEILRTPEVQKHLPSGVGALIDLAAWTPDEIDRAIKNDILHPQSQRKPLQKWLDNKRVSDIVGKAEEPLPDPPTTPEPKIVAYIMVHTEDFNADDERKIEEAIWKLRQEVPSFNFYITTAKESRSISLYRKRDLSARVVKVYAEAPDLFVDPDFAKMVDTKLGGTIINLEYYLHEFAYILASEDHKELHKRLKFSKAEWEFLGVEDPGYSTILKFIPDEGKPMKQANLVMPRPKKK